MTRPPKIRYLIIRYINRKKSRIIPLTTFWKLEYDNALSDSSRKIEKKASENESPSSPISGKIITLSDHHNINESRVNTHKWCSMLTVLKIFINIVSQLKQPIFNAINILFSIPIFFYIAIDYVKRKNEET